MARRSKLKIFRFCHPSKPPSSIGQSSPRYMWDNCSRRARVFSKICPDTKTAFSSPNANPASTQIWGLSHFLKLSKVVPTWASKNWNLIRNQSQEQPWEWKENPIGKWLRIAKHQHQRQNRTIKFIFNQKLHSLISLVKNRQLLKTFVKSSVKKGLLLALGIKNLKLIANRSLEVWRLSSRSVTTKKWSSSQVWSSQMSAKKAQEEDSKQAWTHSYRKKAKTHIWMQL